MTDDELGGVIPVHEFITSYGDDEVGDEGSRIYMPYSDDSVGGHEELPAEVQTMCTNVYGKK